jgi:ethanolamine ammonia-lyase small subunit
MSFDRYRSYTQARIGLGNSGAGIPTKDWLNFSYDHAAAVDAIRAPWDLIAEESNLKKISIQTQRLTSAVTHREEYLLRPDLGRRLSLESTTHLQKFTPETSPSVMILASNGLSSFAIANHLAPFLEVFYAELTRANLNVCQNRVFLIPNGRVAIVDEVGAILKPEIGIVLIGERPGLSSPDSLALYLTHTPKKGRSDADRNCISNIRTPYGLTYEEATFKAMFLIQEAMKRGLSGVNLKDESNLINGPESESK